jgi:hypothetical protein
MRRRSVAARRMNVSVLIEVFTYFVVKRSRSRSVRRIFAAVDARGVVGASFAVCWSIVSRFPDAHTRLPTLAPRL